MAKVELTDADIQNLLVIINQSTIKGESAEAIVSLKNKLRETKQDSGVQE